MTRQKYKGSARDRDTENLVVYLRGHKNLRFSEIGEKLGFTRQRAHAIYARYIKEVEDGNSEV